MNEEEKRQYILAQLGSLPNAIQYVEVTKYIEDLEQQVKKQKEVIDKVNVFLNNHDKNAGNLYYKYNNKYLLSEIKEDIRKILKEVSK